MILGQGRTVIVYSSVSQVDLGLQRKFKVYDKLILRKIIVTVVTRCHILKLNCTQFDFAGALPQTTLGFELTALPDPLAGFKGAYF